MKKISLTLPRLIKLSYRNRSDSKESSKQNYVLFPTENWKASLDFDSEKQAIELVLGAGNVRLCDNLEQAKTSTLIPVGCDETFSLCKEIKYDSIKSLGSHLKDDLLSKSNESVDKYLTVLDIDFHSGDKPDRSCLNGIVPSPEYLVDTDRGYHCFYVSSSRQVPAKQRASLASLWVLNSPKLAAASGIDIISKCRRHSNNIERFYAGSGELYGKSIYRLANAFTASYDIDGSVLANVPSTRVEDWRCPFGDHASSRGNSGLSIYEKEGSVMIHCFRCGKTAPLSATRMDDEGKYILKYKRPDHLYKLYRNKFWSFYLMSDLNRLIRSLYTPNIDKIETDTNRVKAFKKSCIRGLAAYTHGVNSHFHLNCLNEAGDNLVRTIPDAERQPVWVDKRNNLLKSAHLEKIVTYIPYCKYQEGDKIKTDASKALSLVINQSDEANIIPSTVFLKGYRPFGLVEDISSMEYFHYLNPVHTDASLQKIPEHLISNPVDALRVIQDYAVNKVRRLYVDKGEVKRKSIFTTDFPEDCKLKPIPAENLLMTMFQIGYCNTPRIMQLPILLASGDSGGGKNAITAIASAIMGVSYDDITCSSSGVHKNLDRSIQKMRSEGTDVIALSEYFKEATSDGNTISNLSKMEALYGQTSAYVTAEIIYRSSVRLRNHVSITINNTDIPNDLLKIRQILRRVALLPKLTKTIKGARWNNIDNNSICCNEDLYVACHSLREYVLKYYSPYHNAINTDEGKFVGNLPDFATHYDNCKAQAISCGFSELFANEADYISTADLLLNLDADSQAKAVLLDIIHSGTPVTRKFNIQELLCVDLRDKSDIAQQLERLSGQLDQKDFTNFPSTLITKLSESTLLENVDLVFIRDKFKLYFHFKMTSKIGKRTYWKIEELRQNFRLS